VIGKSLEIAPPEDVVRACEKFRQGFLIKTPPLFYLASLKYPLWSLSHAVAEDSAGEDLPDEIVELYDEDRPPYGLITTQTCDLVRPDQQPWLHVAPVFKCKDNDRILDGEFIIPLDPPKVKGSTWYVDLRIEMALEKGVLVDREPIESFPDEAGYIKLADLLARRRGRPALHSVFNQLLTDVMREMRDEDKELKKQLRRIRPEVYKLKLAIEEGDRLAPLAARLHIVTNGPSGDEVRAWFDEWWNRAREVAENSNLNLLPNRWLDASGLDAREYDDLIEVTSRAINP
jgi:hypothetical protein